jgi:galactose oxidase
MVRRAAYIYIGLALAIASLSSLAVHTQTNPAISGEWSPVQGLPYVPIQAALLPTGKVIFWASYTDGDNPYLWDPNTNLFTSARQAGYNIFCSGFCLLPTGGLFLAGGHESDFYGLPNAATYDPVSNSWTRSPDMTDGRWYPTATTLPTGEVLVVAGTVDTAIGSNPLPEVWQPATRTWRGLTTAQLQLPYYPYMFVAPNGKIFNAGPNQTTRSLDTTGT